MVPSPLRGDFLFVHILRQDWTRAQSTDYYVPMNITQDRLERVVRTAHSSKGQGMPEDIDYEFLNNGLWREAWLVDGWIVKTEWQTYGAGLDEYGLTPNQSEYRNYQRLSAIGELPLGFLLPATFMVDVECNPDCTICLGTAHTIIMEYIQGEPWQNDDASLAYYSVIGLRDIVDDNVIVNDSGLYIVDIQG